ncbi:MAG: response regulator [Candidatus Aureabacteria bacterium]|nr:response regulator [Candidatus Auribacterota bacterium]
MAKKILVAEDSPTVLAMVKAAISQEGYEVHTAVDGIEALNKARSVVPDLIILDLMLPKMDGYNICRMLKFDAKFKDTPIFMFTARSGEADKAMGEQMGANEYIPKSASMEELDYLIGKIKEYLGE